tara:strand:- start:2804 stop:2947 length:144 start_codon:yes stop_codon:yes gene_type:complete
MISENQWRLIGEFMDETARNLRIITFVIVISFCANIGAAIWFANKFN